ncbi:MAG: CopG family ribbon-helix-helix protein [Pirellulales bacterium]
MTIRNLKAATKDFDKPFVLDKSRPLDAAEAKQWRRAKRKRGRPKSGQGFRRISVSIEGGLLKEITALAKKRRVSRSKLMADAARVVIAKGR